MNEKFNIWSKSNPSAIENINPKINMREWDELTGNEKEIIFKYFINNKWFCVDFSNLVFNSICKLNNRYKKQSYGINTLYHNGPHYFSNSLGDCCKEISFEDFSNIFLTHKQDIVFELITLYAWHLIDDGFLKSLNELDSPEERKEKIDRAYNSYDNCFDKFAACFNDIFEQFGINVMLTRNALIPRQDDKITNEIFVPVLNFLSDPIWESVNRDLKDAFNDYQLKTDNGYSSCITHAVSALQAFLQILVKGKIGKGEIGTLISKARIKKTIPNDKFTEQIFKNIESILMFERQVTADAHPKNEYATEKNARLVLNLVMIFLQHCIQI